MEQPLPAVPEQLHLAWDARIRVLTNPNVWKPLLLCLGIPSLLLGILFAVVARRPGFVLLVPLGAMAILLPIVVLVAGAVDLFGGFTCHFLVTTHGVRSVAGRGSQAATRAATLAGLLSGRPGMVGTGMLAEHEQEVFIPWSAITRIKAKAGSRYILIKRGWGRNPSAYTALPRTTPRCSIS